MQPGTQEGKKEARQEGGEESIAANLCSKNTMDVYSIWITIMTLTPCFHGHAYTVLYIIVVFC